MSRELWPGVQKLVNNPHPIIISTRWKIEDYNLILVIYQLRISHPYQALDGHTLSEFLMSQIPVCQA